MPKKLRNPDLKLLAYYAGVRYIEFVNMNDSRTGELVDHKYWTIEEKCFVSFSENSWLIIIQTQTVLETKKANWWNCFHWFQDLHQIWYPHNFVEYIKEAQRKWNHPNEFSLCELPGPLNYR